eukprot:6177817-Pleurochrysis_carterae.AAC.2
MRDAAARRASLSASPESDACSSAAAFVCRCASACTAAEKKRRGCRSVLLAARARRWHGDGP